MLIRPAPQERFDCAALGTARPKIGQAECRIGCAGAVGDLLKESAADPSRPRARRIESRARTDLRRRHEA